MSLKTIVYFVGIVVIGVALWLQFLLTKELSPVHKGSAGQIQGVVLKSRAGRDFYAYYGIPYAKPPVDQLRFESPQKLEPWTGIWDGTFHRPRCAQYDFLITGSFDGRSSEDCLYLNVFVPQGQFKDKLPVMVDIHGGYFHMGGPQMQGPHYFMDHDVIIVTMAYRLGVLGFLNTDNGLVKGNMGLKDQNMALQWIQKHIQSFGGDPSRVTIMGESAGSVSVHYHTLSPKSKGLFSRAIRQSGNALSYWTIKGHQSSKREQALAFAERVRCPTKPDAKMVHCLKKIDVEELLLGHEDLVAHPTPQKSKFVPSIEIMDDEAFLTEHPVELVETGKFNKIPTLTGFNTDEGLLHSAVLHANETKLNLAIDNWDDWAPKAFHFPADKPEISKQIFDFYFKPYLSQFKERSDWLQNFTNAFGDRLFIDGIGRSLEHERKFVDEMYNYIYDHNGGFSLATLIQASQASIHPYLTLSWKALQAFVTNQLGLDVNLNIPGTSHADELGLLWYSTEVAAFYSERKDSKLSKELVKFWVDFASGVNPLKFKDLVVPPTGQLEKTEPLKFIRLNSNKAELIENPFQERVNFWRKLDII